MKQVHPYSTDEGNKKKQVTRMFDNIAPYYDLLNRLLSLGIDQAWRHRVVKMVVEDGGGDVLDVATGTADLAIALSKRNEVTKVVGLDIAGEMLAIGRKKVEKKKLGGKTELVLGDSENLPFKNNTFDAVTVAFGVRNFENVERGLIEMRRVLKTNGRVLVLEFSKPKWFPFKQVYNLYFRHVLPFIGRLTSRDPKAYAYLYESVQAFPDYGEFVELMEKCGYSNGKFKVLSLGICCIYSAYK